MMKTSDKILKAQKRQDGSELTRLEDCLTESSEQVEAFVLSFYDGSQVLKVINGDDCVFLKIR